MKKIIVKVIFVAFFLIFLAPKSTFAASNAAATSSFSTDYDVTYKVLDDATTHINFDIVLTNNTTQYYASSYSIQVGFKDIENVKASDPDGPIIPYITKNEDGEEIELTFNKRVVGINNKLNFNLFFDTKSVAKQIGRIWEVNIPGLAQQSNFQSFNVHVRTPDSFGDPSYIKPEIAFSNKNNLDFTKEQLGNSGVYIGFGDFQIYKFNLTYHLENPNLFKVKTEIAIPPSTNYQDIEIEDISPKPLNVVVDRDGNWLAQYQLVHSQKIDVIVKGKAKVTLLPKKETITNEKINFYLKEQPYWEVLNVDIKNLARTLKTPYAIYEYLVKNLTYDFSRVTERKGRLGAANVLKDPKSAVCLEFTDLFVALARAAGIPARGIDGFAYTQNPKERPLSLVKDVLHAWPEFYDFDRQTWIMVDPTWGNTTRGLDYFNTLDFDHFAFVIKGENSSYPVPAGGYKLEEDELSKDVIVGFGENFDEITPKLILTESFSDSNFSGLPINGQIKIKNAGQYILESQTVTVSSNFLTPTHQEFLIDKIPPFGFLTVDVNYHKTPILTNLNDVVTITVNGESVSKNLRIAPFFLHKLSLLTGGVLFVVTTIILSIVTIKTRHISFLRRKEQDIIRWKSEKLKKES